MRQSLLKGGGHSSGYCQVFTLLIDKIYVFIEETNKNLYSFSASLHRLFKPVTGAIAPSHTTQHFLKRI
jgi:hypothetical protein